MGSIAEDIRSRECRVVIGVLGSAKSRALRRWRQAESALSEASSEARDSVRHLSALEKPLQPLFGGSPSTAAEVLPDLMSSIKALHNAARSYSSARSMTRLLRKVVHGMTSRCMEYIAGGDVSASLWDQPALQLVERMRASLSLTDAFREHYYRARDDQFDRARAASGAATKPFDFSESTIFEIADRFSRRLEKLVEVITAVAHFSPLAEHEEVEWMVAASRVFSGITAQLRSAPYALLDLEVTQFDTDYDEFSARIMDLEVMLRDSIHLAFDGTASSEQAQRLLLQLQGVLQRDAFRDELVLIFGSYAVELEAVQMLYEKGKESPPVARNLPPTTGAILWARQLMRRIEEPMMQFQASPGLMRTREARKIVKLYNRVASAIVGFETLWHVAWIKSIEASKAGLAATLIVRHPSDNRLYVNFDRELLCLIREAKCLMRHGLEVPKSARAVLQQEARLKMYHNTLTHALRKYDAVVQAVPATASRLLSPQLDELMRRIRPGMVTLTWSSINIDGFLHRVHEGLLRLEDLVSAVRDLLECIESNVRAVAGTMLVNLPAGQIFHLEQFVLTQEQFASAQMAAVAAKSQEAAEATSRLLELIEASQLEACGTTPLREEKNRLRSHFGRSMLHAVRSCTMASLAAVTKRVGRFATGIFFLQPPLFLVDVELTIPGVSMTPSLEQYQAALDQCCRAVIAASRLPLSEWDCGSVANRSVLKDMGVVKMVLLLAGSIERAKQQVEAHLTSLAAPYEWLWGGDDATFTRLDAVGAPLPCDDLTLEELDAALRKYSILEASIHSIPPVQNIGALSLSAATFKHSLCAEAAARKASYAQILHARAQKALHANVAAMDDLGSSLRIEVSDLDSIRSATNHLRVVRQKDGVVAQEFLPVEEMYALLVKHGAHVPKDEASAVSAFAPRWRQLLHRADKLSEAVSARSAALRTDVILNVKHFIGEASKFCDEFAVNGPADETLAPADGQDRLLRFQRECALKCKAWEEYRSNEELLGLPVTDLPELTQARKELGVLGGLYSLHARVATELGAYGNLRWEDVAPRVDEMASTAGELQRSYKALPKQVHRYLAFLELKRSVDEFADALPLVVRLAHPCMRPRHWSLLVNVTGRTLNVMSDRFRLSDLLQESLVEFSDGIEDIVETATKEQPLEQVLLDVSEEWSNRRFTFDHFKARGPILLRDAVMADMMRDLEEARVRLSSAMSSRHIGPFVEEVDAWSLKLSAVAETLELWVEVQAMWKYVEAVYSSSDIAIQLPLAAKHFRELSKIWEELMTKALEARQIVQHCAGNDSLRSTLSHLLNQLSVCQRTISSHLALKRAVCPRLYFVSDAQLLRLVSQEARPHTLRPHLAPLFSTVDRVEFDAAHRMVGIASGDGHTVPLCQPVSTDRQAEEWLMGLTQAMQSTVGQLVHKAVLNATAMLHDDGRGDARVDVAALRDFLHAHIAQASLFGLQLLWTLEVEESILRACTEHRAMSACRKKIGRRLEQLVRCVGEASGDPLSAHTRRKLEGLVLMGLHQRDSFAYVYAVKGVGITDFAWSQQMRCYWEEERNVAKVAVARTAFDYCNEYLAATARHVITPLTSRCFIALSQTLASFSGGALVGPNGTGKTETIRCLGALLGQHVLVANCTDQTGHQTMGQVIKGVAQVGCWGCFDHLSRSSPAVLSVLAQQVGCVLAAVRDGRPTASFVDGELVHVNRRLGVFATSAPSVERQEMPDNLRALFRGVSMPAPDRRFILCALLVAAGYEDSEGLSARANVLLSLCEQQLSPQAHYDFGLPNLHAVAGAAGYSKRTRPSDPEADLIAQSIRSVFLPALVEEDEPIFLELVGEVFGSVGTHESDSAAGKPPAPEVARSVSQAALRHTVQQELISALPGIGLQAQVAWVERVMQLYDVSLARHFIVTVGLSGTGKSSLVRALHTALQSHAASATHPALGQQHQELRMNPKAVSVAQMFGSFDTTTGEWTEGVFASLWRKANKDRCHCTWVVLDGPIDDAWTENLNTVLDSNPVLTLANSDRLPMLRPNVTLHFEAEDLRNASPATVAHSGVVHLSLADLGWMPLVETWLSTREAVQQSVLRPLVESILSPLLEMACECGAGPSPLALLASTLCLLDSMLAAFAELDIGAETFVRIFLFCSVWGIAGALPAAEQVKLDQELRKHSRQMPTGCVFDFGVDEVSGDWVPWSSRVPRWEVPAGIQLDQALPSLLVPTAVSVRNAHLQELHRQAGRGVLLVGGAGVAKTSMALQMLARQDRVTTCVRRIAATGATTPAAFQAQIQSAVEKRPGRAYGPLGGKASLLCFVDDVSSLAADSCGDRPTLEAMRQLMEHAGVYSHTRPGVWESIQDVAFVGAMLGAREGGRDVPNRLKRHFLTVRVSEPSADAMQQIFGPMIRAHFSPESGAPPDVLAASEKLTSMTVLLCQALKQKLVPTPTKFHYSFGLRDIARVLQGIFTCPVLEVLESEGVVASLWAHECLRVFADRLVDQADKTLFASVMHKALEDSFGKTRAERVLNQPAHFVAFMRGDGSSPEPGAAERVYAPVEDLQAVRECVQEQLERFSAEYPSSATPLVLFTDALHHLMRITRVLGTPRGCMLLVGVAGSGKGSLARLAAFVEGARFFHPVTVDPDQTASTLAADLEPAYRMAGVAARPVMLLLNERDLREDVVAENVSSFLSTGVFPTFEGADERAHILKSATFAWSKAGAGTNGEHPLPEQVWSWFSERARNNLHLVICSPPGGTSLLQQGKRFPAIISGCTVNWILPWPKESLTEIARSFLGPLELEGGEAKQTLAALIEHAVETHTLANLTANESGRACATLRSYYHFLRELAEAYPQKVDEVTQHSATLSDAVLRLEQAIEGVDGLQSSLDDKESEVAAIEEKVQALLQDIVGAQASAEKEKAAIQAMTDALASKVGGFAEERRRINAVSAPVIDAAVEALAAITEPDVDALKSLDGDAPEATRRLFDCVLLLLHEAMLPIGTCEGEAGLILEPSFSVAQRVVSRATFHAELRGCAAEMTNDETLEFLFPYIGLPLSATDAINPPSAASLSEGGIRQNSGSIAGLYTWCEAMATHVVLMKAVSPELELLKQQEKALEVEDASVARARRGLSSIQSQLDKMQVTFDACMAEKQALRREADTRRRKMTAVQRCIDDLSHEYSRWKTTSEACEERLRHLAGDVAHACALLSYAGPFNSRLRGVLKGRLTGDCVQRGIPHTPATTLHETLSCEAAVSEWVSQGLTRDDFAIQNAVIVIRSRRWPLLIDPQGQGKRWIASREKCNQLRVSSPTDRFFHDCVEDALSFGLPLLLEGIGGEALDPLLDPLLEKRVQSSSQGQTVSFAGKDCEYDESFRLYMVSELSSPHWPQEVWAMASVVDFTVSNAGLDEQLLGLVVSKERPELEDKHLSLAASIAAKQKTLRGVEDDLLQRLAHADGSLLDDDTLVEALHSAQQAAAAVVGALTSATEEASRIDATRELYRPVAALGRVIYLLIVDVAALSPMYTISLEQFLEVYEASFRRADKAVLVEKRVENLVEALRYQSTCYMHRSMFWQHRTPWTLMLAMRVEAHAGTLFQSAIEALLHTGAELLSIAAERTKPLPWIPDRVWLNIIQLSRKVEVFKELPEVINRNDILWKHWFEDDAPEEARLPDYADKCSAFEKLLLVRCLRQDRTMLSIQAYITETLGRRFIDSRPLDLRAVEAESSPRTPVIAMLSGGSGPAQAILGLAKRRDRAVLTISMGQGQDDAARRLVQTAVTQGCWVLVQNGHLGLGLMEQLEEMMARFEDVPTGFRLWITSQPHDRFPLGLLKRSTKVADEPPRGVRARLKRMYATMPPELLDAASQPADRKALYALAFMHSVVQERRSGFRAPYDFGPSDWLAAARDLVRRLAEARQHSQPLDWAAVRYMVCGVYHGGRVADEWDRRLLHAYSQLWLTPRVVDAGFEFHPGYGSSESGEVEGHRRHIEGLPHRDDPALLGLTAGADRSLRTAEAHGVLTAVLSVEPKGDSHEATREEADLEQVRALRATLPTAPDPGAVRLAMKALGARPLHVALRQEIEQMRRLLTAAGETLDGLERAMQGAIALTPQLADAMGSIRLAAVPAGWARASQMCSHGLGSWIAELRRRSEQLTKWLHGHRPACFWLGGLFNPQGLLAANRQEVCRGRLKEGWTLGDVVDDVRVLNVDEEDVRKPPEEGVYICGVHLEGGTWDRRLQQLDEPHPTETQAPLPVLHATAALRSAARGGRVASYACPCYANASRDRFLFEVELPSADEPAKWLMRGVAMIASVGKEDG